MRKKIREYIQAMLDSGNEDITSEWVERAGIGKRGMEVI